jgi:hypothetical protein
MILRVLLLLLLSWDVLLEILRKSEERLLFEIVLFDQILNKLGVYLTLALSRNHVILNRLNGRIRRRRLYRRNRQGPFYFYTLKHDLRGGELLKENSSQGFMRFNLLLFRFFFGHNSILRRILKRTRLGSD